jgi:hypothetical protein
VFVRQWLDYDSVDKDDAASILLPKQLWLPDGRVVPICVVEAAAVELDRVPIETLLFPGSFVGAGYPVVTNVQGGTRVGTIGPLVTNGQRLFALTSRHVLGPTGSDVETFVHGASDRIGTCADGALTRVPVADVYPGLETDNAFLNLDVGLIDVDSVDRWTSVAYGIGPLAPVADERSASLSLALIGRTVVAHGAAGGAQRGQIKALLFRYKTIGGAEYFTDFLIGSADEGRALTTRPGDSGALWCLEPDAAETAEATPASSPAETRRAPLAVQWGGEVLNTSAGQSAPYVLASSVATICRLLDLDVVWDWQASLFRYWGGVGHYSIALLAIQALPPGDLRTLLEANLANITFPKDQINDDNFEGLSKRFVPLADVPDLAWKIGAGQRGPRATNPERPNHFADMDRPGPDGRTLLDICTSRRRALQPQVWLDYYESIGVKNPIEQGLLPFRVWQIYDGMVDAVGRRSVTQFVCAAGVLAHYVGDACQPLHISIYSNGDPDKKETRTVSHRDGTTTETHVAVGSGVHTAYEDDMVNRHVGDIFLGVQSLPHARLPRVRSGGGAAWDTIKLMRRTVETIPPPDLVATYAKVENDTPANAAKELWNVYGQDTIEVIGDGVRTLAGLWLSAWREAGGDDAKLDLGLISQATITKTVLKPSFLRSYTLDKIGANLS